MITKIGAALVSSAVKPAKYQQIQPVQQIEKKPITPTTQTQDVANNIRGLSQGYDSREGFGRPNLGNMNVAGGSGRMNAITKMGSSVAEPKKKAKEEGLVSQKQLRDVKKLVNGVIEANGANDQQSMQRRP